MFVCLFFSHLPDQIFQHCGVVNEGVKGVGFDGLEALLNGAAVVAERTKKIFINNIFFCFKSRNWKIFSLDNIFCERTVYHNYPLGHASPLLLYHPQQLCHIGN